MDEKLSSGLIERFELAENYVAMVIRPQDELLRAAMAAYEKSLKAGYLHKAA